MQQARRLKFYDGFFTYAKDWQEEQDYHRQRRKHHLRHFHTPGVARGLEVHATDDDPDEPNVSKPFGVLIEVGSAVDRNGEDLIVDRPMFRDLASELPPSGSRRVILCIKHVDSPQEPDGDNPGEWQRMAESVDIDVIEIESEIGDRIEIARIDLDKGNERLRASDIDMRHRAAAGSIGVSRKRSLEEPERDWVDAALGKTERAFRLLQQKFEDCLLAGDVRHCALNARMSLAGDDLYYRTLVPMLDVIRDLAQQTTKDIRPKCAARDLREDYVDPIDQLVLDLKDALDDADHLTHETPDPIRLICNALSAVADRVANLSGETHAVSGQDMTVAPRTRFELIADESTPAPDRKIDSYLWEIHRYEDWERHRLQGTPLPKPAWSTATSGEQPHVKQTVDRLDPGRYVRVLTVKDSEGMERSSNSEIFVKGEKPVANAGENRSYREGAKVYLFGVKSIDRDGGQIVNYKWTEVESKDHRGGHSFESGDAQVEVPYQLQPGEHVFELVVVDDETQESEPDRVTIRIKPAY